MWKSEDTANIREFLNSSNRHLIVAGGLVALTFFYGMPSVRMFVAGLFLGGLLAACLAMAWRRRLPVSLPLLYVLLPVGWHLSEGRFFSGTHMFASIQGLMLMYLAYFGTLYLFRVQIIRYARLEAPTPL